MLVLMDEMDEFDLCAICENKGTDSCFPCEIPYVCLNKFYPDEEKIRKMLDGIDYREQSIGGEGTR